MKKTLKIELVGLEGDIAKAIAKILEAVDSIVEANEDYEYLENERSRTVAGVIKVSNEGEEEEIPEAYGRCLRRAEIAAVKTHLHAGSKSFGYDKFKELVERALETGRINKGVELDKSLPIKPSNFIKSLNNHLKREGISIRFLSFSTFSATSLFGEGAEEIVEKQKKQNHQRHVFFYCFVRVDQITEYFPNSWRRPPKNLYID